MTAPDAWEAVRLMYFEWLKERQPLDVYIMRHADPPATPAELWSLLERSRDAEHKFMNSLAALLGQEAKTEG
jgi:hypothetical protein